MFLGRVTNWTSVVGTDIPFMTVRNSNNKITNRNGLLSLNQIRDWTVNASLVLSGVADDVIVSVYADGVQTGAFAEATVTATGYVTVPIVDAIKTVYAQYPDVGTISLRVDTAGVNVSGSIVVEYVA